MVHARSAFNGSTRSHSGDPPEVAAEAPPRRAYPTDLTDAEWRKTRPLLPPPPENPGRPRETDLRDIVSAIRYRWVTGCSWRMLPHDFPPWGTVYAYYREWRKRGLLAELRQMLARKTETESDRVPRGSTGAARLA
jgi:transposase